MTKVDGPRESRWCRFVCSARSMKSTLVALVLAPTRELASQIDAEIRTLARDAAHLCLGDKDRAFEASVFIA